MVLLPGLLFVDVPSDSKEVPSDQRTPSHFTFI